MVRAFLTAIWTTTNGHLDLQASDTHFLRDVSTVAVQQKKHRINEDVPTLNISSCRDSTPRFRRIQIGHCCADERGGLLPIYTQVQPGCAAVPGWLGNTCAKDLLVIVDTCSSDIIHLG